MTITTRLNDVDLATVAGLVGNIRTDPEHAKTTWQASVSWQGAFRSEARVREFDPIQSDEPAALGGTDTAPNPVEQVLAALGHCLAVGYAANASAEGIGINELTIDLEGDLDLHTFLGLAEWPRWVRQHPRHGSAQQRRRSRRHRRPAPKRRLHLTGRPHPGSGGAGGCHAGPLIERRNT